MTSICRVVLLCVLLCTSAYAQEAELRLGVPPELEDSGFMQYLVPRFSLKTGVRIVRVLDAEDVDMVFGSDGTVVFEGLGQVWSLAINDDPRTQRFLDWLRSDVGRRTIDSFESTTGEKFGAQIRQEAATVELAFDGDAIAGERLSLTLCGRCHVINETNRLKGMGSTPSFGLLRTFEDWQTRFATFHQLLPHPSFTQIDGITSPFDPSLPPPIVPLSLTLDDLESILAYVAGIEPADLGAPLQFQ